MLTLRPTYHSGQRRISTEEIVPVGATVTVDLDEEGAVTVDIVDEYDVRLYLMLRPAEAAALAAALRHFADEADV